MFRKRAGLLGITVLLVMLAGAVCALVYEKYEEKAAVMKQSSESVQNGNDKEEAVQIAELYRDIYKRAAETDAPDSVEVMRQIVERLGEHGFTVVDGDNQIDMANPEPVKRFIGQQETGGAGELRIIRVLYPGGFVIYDMETKGGRVSIARGYYEYAEDGILRNGSTDRYDADFWEYTEEGYLLFEGELFSEEQYAMEMGEMAEHVAMRVEPLSEECRSYNREYIRPVGYGRNNLFLLDWNEEDFGEIDFQDLFDILYPHVYGKKNPYAERGIETGQVSHVPEKEFEHVIQSYFDIESKALREKAEYFPEDRSYGFRTRGMGELEFPEIPYPEVVNYVENEDGTITFLVNAVYPEKNCARAYSHEVTVRILDEDRIRYVSNYIIPSEYNDLESWHKNRLKKEEIQ